MPAAPVVENDQGQMGSLVGKVFFAVSELEAAPPPVDNANSIAAAIINAEEPSAVREAESAFVRGFTIVPVRQPKSGEIATPSGVMWGAAVKAVEEELMELRKRHGPKVGRQMVMDGAKLRYSRMLVSKARRMKSRANRTKHRVDKKTIAARDTNDHLFGPGKHQNMATINCA